MALSLPSAEFVASLATLAAIGFGLYQYRRAQVWKKSEFAAAQLQRLSDDPDLAQCCVFLDWGARRIPVPQKYEVFEKENLQSFVHNWQNVKKAMRVVSKETCHEEAFPFPLVLYRDMFDRYFAYLDRINHYIEVGLFTVEDVCPLRYWLNQIQASDHLEKEDQDVFLNFCDHYGYPGVKELIRKFNREKEQVAAGMKERRCPDLDLNKDLARVKNPHQSQP